MWELAAADFKAALAIVPRYDFGNNNLGVYYAGIGQNDLAKKYFLRALEAKPQYSDALGNLCTIYMKEGDFASRGILWREGNPNSVLQGNLSRESRKRLAGLHNFKGAKAESKQPSVAIAQYPKSTASSVCSVSKWAI